MMAELGLRGLKCLDVECWTLGVSYCVPVSLTVMCITYPQLSYLTPCPTNSGPAQVIPNPEMQIIPD